MVSTGGPAAASATGPRLHPRATRVGCPDHGSRVFPPPDVAERNDILLDNRVPIRMRDGVSLYADVFRRSETSGIPSSSRERRIAPSGFRRRMKPVLTPRRRGYVARVPGRQGAPRIGRPVGAVLRR